MACGGGFYISFLFPFFYLPLSLPYSLLSPCYLCLLLCPGGRLTRPAAARQGRILILSMFFDSFISFFVLFNHNTFQLQTLVNNRINNTFFYFCLLKNPMPGVNRLQARGGAANPPVNSGGKGNRCWKNAGLLNLKILRSLDQSLDHNEARFYRHSIKFLGKNFSI